MHQRIFGTECEYAPVLHGPGECVRTERCAENLRDHQKQIAARLMAGAGTLGIPMAGEFLGNGGRLYVDRGGHPEYATPECCRVADLMAYEIAGDRLVRKLAETLNTKDGYWQDETHRLHLYKKNIRKREIIRMDQNRRLHLIVGDSNMAQYSIGLKIGTMVLMLRLLEAGVLDADFEPLSPAKALKAVSRDLRAKIGVRHQGRCSDYTALEIQSICLEKALRYYAANTPGAEEAQWLQNWEHILSGLQDLKIRQADMALERDGAELRRKIDWILKLWLLDRSRSKGANEKQLKKLDLKYHDLDPDTGLYERCLALDLVDRMIPERDIEAAGSEPPQNTRARLRGLVVQETFEKHAKVHVEDWERIRIQACMDDSRARHSFQRVISGVNSMAIRLENPFRAEDPQIMDKLQEFINKWVDKMKDDPAYRGNLRQMLIEQFMLHEVQHHHLMDGKPHPQAPLTPVAHTLIDIYKCLHQGEFGVGHTLDHPEGFKQRLYQEIMRGVAEDHVGEPAVESVSADGTMLRINLRCLRRLYRDDVPGAVDGLVRVCIESAQVSQGSSTRFFETLDLFKMLNQAGEIALAGHVFAFPPASVETFFSEVRELIPRIRQIPVFSHSASYRKLNRPAYRVVERSVLQASPLAILLKRENET